MKKLKFISFDGKMENSIIVNDDIKEISVAYDGGRLTITINGLEVYETAFAGNDFQFDIEDQNENEIFYENKLYSPFDDSIEYHQSFGG